MRYGMFNFSSIASLGPKKPKGFSERRTYRRLNICNRRMVFCDFPKLSYWSEIVDLSEGGVCLRIPNFSPRFLGLVINAELNIMGTKYPVELVARNIRKDSVGLSFHNLNGLKQTTLRHAFKNLYLGERAIAEKMSSGSQKETLVYKMLGPSEVIVQRDPQSKKLYRSFISINTKMGNIRIEFMGNRIASFDHKIDDPQVVDAAINRIRAHLLGIAGFRNCSACETLLDAL